MSLNCKGLRDRRKVGLLAQFLGGVGWDVAFLQETHLTGAAEEAGLFGALGCVGASSFGGAHSGGPDDRS